MVDIAITLAVLALVAAVLALERRISRRPPPLATDDDLWILVSV